ncbi:MAG: metallophosphoesterase [Chitinophagales bacterium]
MKKYLLLLFWSVAALQLMAQDLVRGPYLQSLAQTSIKVVWRTDQPAVGSVEVAMEPGGTVIYTSQNDTSVTDHIVLLEGLQPENVYYYRIKADDNYLTAWQASHHFKTSSYDTEHLSFWVTGDFGSGNQKQINVRKAFETDVTPNFPDFWLWLGDNAYDDGKDQEFQDKVFTPPYGYDSLLTFLPFYPVPGNHDYKSVNMFAPPPQHRGPYFDIVEVPKNGEAGGTPSNTELYYSFDYGNAHFVAINSEAFAYTFFRNSVMEQWLEADLAASDKLWKIVYWHQPPYSKGSHDSDLFYEIFMKAMRDNYTRVVERMGVDVVLCGHSHVYERSHLIRGHYGKSGSFKPEMFIDNEPPYVKYIDGDSANYGTMYIVEGNSGKGEGNAPGGHPIFAATDYGDDAVGSLVINIDKNVLTGRYIKGDGNIGDEFTITKVLRDSSVITGLASNYVEAFKVFPNPAKNELNVSFSMKETLPVNFQIVSMDGKVYLNEKGITYSKGANNKSFNLSKLNMPTGSYIVRIGGGEGNATWRQETVIKVQ